MSTYFNALSATAIISTIPNVLLILIPSYMLQPSSAALHPLSLNYQNLFFAFASGGLLGDVFLHVLPHLIAEHAGKRDHHDHHDHHDHNGHDYHDNEGHDHGDSFIVVIGMFLVLGYLLFFIVERLSSAAAATRKLKIDGEDEHADKCAKGELSVMNKISAVGWLNLTADAMHNFTDGLAIGAAFAVGKSNQLALSTFLSVLFHEVPHEIGDFSVLINSGLTKYEAIKAQYVTAIAAMIGTYVGLMFQRNEKLEDILLAMTSGGFIYIATTSMMPTMLASKQSSPKQIMWEFNCFLLGVGFMAAVLLLEDEDHHH